MEPALKAKVQPPAGDWENARTISKKNCLRNWAKDWANAGDLEVVKAKGSACAVDKLMFNLK
jgi:hypothetical protein